MAVPVITSLTHRLKYLPFKPICAEWIKQGLKETTFRSRRYDNLYDVVTGSRYKRRPIGLVIKSIPIMNCEAEDVINTYFRTEGPFRTAQEFKDWLGEVNLTLPDVGWLHHLTMDSRARAFQLEEAGVRI